jgi:uncharacterized protein YggE
MLAGGSALAFLSLTAAVCGDTRTTVQNSEDQPRGISVSGEGIVQGAPDVATISLGVSTLRDTVVEARTEAATALTAMVDSLKANDVEEKDIQTSGLSIQPEYDFTDGRQLLRGFRVTNMLTAKLRDIDRTGEIVDEAVEAGGDNTTINGISFSIDDPEQLKGQAREAAVADARSRAETLATASGVSLGDPITISETSYLPPVYYERGVAADSAAGAPVPETPIEAGELDVVVQVSITWEIE